MEASRMLHVMALCLVVSAFHGEGALGDNSVGRRLSTQEDGSAGMLGSSSMPLEDSGSVGPDGPARKAFGSSIRQFYDRLCSYSKPWFDVSMVLFVTLAFLLIIIGNVIGNVIALNIINGIGSLGDSTLVAISVIAVLSFVGLAVLYFVTFIVRNSASLPKPTENLL
ncbi:hypothetical protein X943_000182 [Babesia divergens]|uniref:Uncharacterized protein n=1 Tax=Babesia divergens TaxID=32595 RepID=A0AAD9GF28_BABDI|nr:hypothetical protein X943_000182 [Babesia divergens]